MSLLTSHVFYFTKKRNDIANLHNLNEVKFQIISIELHNLGRDWHKLHAYFFGG